MSLDTQLRATTPHDLPPLDHDRLQRSGRRRRAGTRLAAGTTAVALLTGGGLALAELATPVPEVPFLGADDAGETAPTDVPRSPDEATPAPADGPEVADPDPAVVEAFADLAHAEVIDRLRETLAATPQRPDDLVSITAYERADGTSEVTELAGDETWEDFPVVSVVHPDFDPNDGFETPALQPTWTQDAAELALGALEVGRTFTGVEVDALGRTVLVFVLVRAPSSGENVMEQGPSDQRIHVDPASGYTSGIVFGAGEWGDDPEPGAGEELDTDGSDDPA